MRKFHSTKINHFCKNGKNIHFGAHKNLKFVKKICQDFVDKDHFWVQQAKPMVKF